VLYPCRVSEQHDRVQPGQNLIAELGWAVGEEVDYLGAASATLDIYFLSYLRQMSRFGYFTFGPIHIDVAVVEDIVIRNLVKAPPGTQGSHGWAGDFDFVDFSRRLMSEVERSGRRRIDELHYLLTFMRLERGLPKRVFGELGVSPSEVEEYARRGGPVQQALEKLFSPEEAAEYLNIHVQTVRAWIRSGRLRARRLTGQRALRITATDLQSVLEPVSPGDA
jgi:excisionase family DNA binding protein